MSDPMGPDTNDDRRAAAKLLAQHLEQIEQRHRTSQEQTWIAAEKERVARQVQVEEHKRQEEIRRRAIEDMTIAVGTRLREAANRAGHHLREQISQWIVRNGASSGPEAHTRVFYAEHVMESADLLTSLSRKAATEVGTGRDATATMKQWEKETAYLSLLTMLMLERQRGEIARKVALRLATKRTGEDR